MVPKDLALKLRKEGYSYTYIHQKTKLSKSTLSHLLRNVPYVPNTYTQKSVGMARAKSAESKAREKRRMIEQTKLSATKDIGRLTRRDIFLLGLGLYIGEGSKTQNLVRLVNSDPKVIRLFIQWLRVLGYPCENLSIRIHLYPDSDVKEVESYWARITGLSPQQFQRACIDKRVNKDRKRSRTHQHGTAHVTVRSMGNKKYGVEFSRLIGAWMEKVLEWPTKY